jgi:hypothetical protein
MVNSSRAMPAVVIAGCGLSSLSPAPAAPCTRATTGLRGHGASLICSCVAACGSLWQRVAACGSVWQLVAACVASLWRGSHFVGLPRGACFRIGRTPGSGPTGRIQDAFGGLEESPLGRWKMRRLPLRSAPSRRPLEQRKLLGDDGLLRCSFSRMTLLSTFMIPSQHKAGIAVGSSSRPQRPAFWVRTAQELVLPSACPFCSTGVLTAEALFHPPYLSTSQATRWHQSRQFIRA